MLWLKFEHFNDKLVVKCNYHKQFSALSIGVDDIFDLDACVGFITSKKAKIMAEVFNKRLLKLGTTRVQWVALYYLGSGSGISQKELADKMDIKESSIVRLIDRMEKEGLLNRSKSTEDRRITHLVLTDKGKMLREDLLPEGEKMSDIFLKGISEADIETFNKVLNQMVENAKTLS